MVKGHEQGFQRTNRVNECMRKVHHSLIIYHNILCFMLYSFPLIKSAKFKKKDWYDINNSNGKQYRWEGKLL